MTVEVLLDIHEPIELQTALERHDTPDDVLLTKLETADIVVGRDLDVVDHCPVGEVYAAFERKDLSDYVNSMRSGRLERQVHRMGSYFDHNYVLVEGDLFQTEQLEHTQMKPESVRGHMASLTARDDHPVHSVMCCSTTELLADMALRLARKHSEEPTSARIATGSVENDEPPGMQMWGCLPGVGPERAERLYEAFGTPGRFTSGMSPLSSIREEATEKLTSVEGVGDETATEIVGELWGGAP